MTQPLTPSGLPLHPAYRILTEEAVSAVGTDFEAAAGRLGERVLVLMQDGWRPQGGIAVGEPLGGGQPTLLQALVKGPRSAGPK